MQAGEILGQAYPAASTLTDLYTVPSSKRAFLAYVRVVNHSGSAQTFRLAIAPGGAADSQAHYWERDKSVPANDCLMISVGAALGASDVIRVYSSGSCSFTALGGR
jgi:hypothetical protein